MMENDIIEEVWRNRDEFAKQHNYDLNDMVSELQKMEQKPFGRLVDRRKLASNNDIKMDAKQRGGFLKALPR